MSVHKILFADDPLLRQKSQKVRRVEAATQTLIDDMIETMRAGNGVGLAAPQIGVLKRIIVIEVPAEEDSPEDSAAKSELHALINPEIVKYGNQEEIAEEGCLCLPHYVAEVRRSFRVTVKGRDRKGKEVRIKGEGLLARALQHEVDHLDGILFTDRVEDMSTLHFVPPKGEPEASSEM
jgi:peptide deformylase